MPELDSSYAAKAPCVSVGVSREPTLHAVKVLVREVQTQRFLPDASRAPASALMGTTAVCHTITCIA